MQMVLLTRLDDKGVMSDLCYNVRHFELHGRKLEDPWSCRQSAIHQNFYFANERSNCIVIQPPTLCLAVLKTFEVEHRDHPMGLHTKFLTAALANWRSYLNYLTSKLTEIVGRPIINF